MKSYLSSIIISLLLIVYCSNLSAQQISISEARYQELTQQEKKKEELARDIEALNKKSQDTEAAINKIKEDAKLQDAIKKYTDLQKEKANLEKTSTQENQLQAKKDSLEGAVKKIETEIAAKQADFSDLDALKKHNQAANEVLIQTKMQYEQDKENYAEAKKTALVQEKQILNAEKNQWEQARSNYTKYSTALSILKAYLQTLKNKQAENEKTLKELAQVEENYKKTEAERNALKTILEDVRK